MAVRIEAARSQMQLMARYIRTELQDGEDPWKARANDLCNEPTTKTHAGHIEKSQTPKASFGLKQCESPKLQSLNSKKSNETVAHIQGQEIRRVVDVVINLVRYIKIPRALVAS